jgi:hypothetical protein
VTDTSTSTPTKVDVWLVADHGDRRPPSRAITDGSPAPVSVDARPFGYRLRRLRVTLPVDAATARRIVLADRCNLIAGVLALCYVVFALAMLILATVAFLTQRWPLVLVLASIGALPGVGLAVLPPLAVHALRPAQYPQVKPGGMVLVGAVDPAAADEWTALNPPGTVRATPFTRSAQ